MSWGNQNITIHSRRHHWHLRGWVERERDSLFSSHIKHHTVLTNYRVFGLLCVSRFINTRGQCYRYGLWYSRSQNTTENVYSVYNIYDTNRQNIYLKQIALPYVDKPFQLYILCFLICIHCIRRKKYVLGRILKEFSAERLTSAVQNAFRGILIVFWYIAEILVPLHHGTKQTSASV